MVVRAVRVSGQLCISIRRVDVGVQAIECIHKLNVNEPTSRWLRCDGVHSSGRLGSSLALTRHVHAVKTSKVGVHCRIRRHDSILWHETPVSQTNHLTLSLWASAHGDQREKLNTSFHESSLRRQRKRQRKRHLIQVEQTKNALPLVSQNTLFAKQQHHLTMDDVDFHPLEDPRSPLLRPQQSIAS